MAVLDYLNVITSQHREKPKYISMVSAYLEKVQDVINCADSFDTKFSLQLAEGSQQDILGRILNVSRILQFYSAEGTGVLSDEDYKLVLISKTLQNNWDGSLQDLYDIWDQLFPDTPIKVVDYQNMVADIYLMGDITTLQLELLNNKVLILKTLGVTINYYNADRPIFAYDTTDPFVTGDSYAGYDTGYYLDTL